MSLVHILNPINGLSVFYVFFAPVEADVKDHLHQFFFLRPFVVGILTLSFGFVFVRCCFVHPFDDAAFLTLTLRLHVCRQPVEGAGCETNTIALSLKNQSGKFV